MLIKNLGLRNFTSINVQPLYISKIHWILIKLSFLCCRLSGDEYLKLKQELRDRKRRLKTLPRFRLKAVGESASLSVNSKGEDRIPIFLSDVQHLLLYSLHGHHSPYMPTRWCHLEKYNKVTNTLDTFCKQI